MTPSPTIPPGHRAPWFVTDGRRPIVACWSHGEAVLVTVILSGAVPQLRVMPNPAEVLRVLGLWDREDRDDLLAALWAMLVADPRGGLVAWGVSGPATGPSGC